jgi:hypothetical protein
MTNRPISRRPASLPALAAFFVLALLASFSLPARAETDQQKPPAELLRAAIQNEINDDAHTHLFAWKERSYHGPTAHVERIVQTPSGVVTHLMLIDDQPLTPAQQAAENERIRHMIEPAQMRRKQKEQQADDARTSKLLASIPDAFDFVYLGSATAPKGHELATFKFTPRAGFNPPSRESMVFTAMQGEVVLDKTAMRLAKIDGTLYKDVEFGWGILGRLYKGGRFLVEQSEVAPSHWDTTRMLLHFDGKALLFKSIHIDDNETSWDYRPVPPMSVEKAVDFLTHPDPPQNARLRP